MHQARDYKSKINISVIVNKSGQVLIAKPIVNILTEEEIIRPDRIPFDFLLSSD